MGGCHDSIAALQRAARQHLARLAAGPRYTGNELKDDKIHARFRIELLQAMNDIDTAELRVLSHSRMACNCYTETTTHNTTTLATALIGEVKDKLEKMEVIAARIKDRSDMIQKLEQYPRIFSNIHGSRDITLPVDGTPDLIDLDAPSSMTTWVPQPEPASGSSSSSSYSSSSTLVSPTTAPLVLPSLFLPIMSPQHLEADWGLAPPAAPTNITFSNPQPREEPETESSPPAFQIPDTEGRERLRSLPPHLRVQGPLTRNSNPSNDPLFFRHGIQYRPPVPSSSNANNINGRNNNGNQTAHSHMVIFTNLHPGTTAHDLLSKVRGGPVLRAVGASSDTALVTFVRAADASAYVSYVHYRILTDPLLIRGRDDVVVSLAPTASYPPRDELLFLIARRGVTRCLALPRWESQIAAFVAQRRARGFVEARRIVLVPWPAALLRCNDGDGDGHDWPGVAAGAGAGAGEYGWIGSGLDEEKRFSNAAAAASAMATDDTSPVVLVSFRDVGFAQAAFEALRRSFPRCGVRYAPDPCAGPLSELE